MYKIGVVYIWQNQTGDLAYLNGTETTVLGPVEPYFDLDKEQMRMGQRTDTVEPEFEMWAEAGDLRPKDLPSCEKSILDLFQPQPELEPA